MSASVRLCRYCQTPIQAGFGPFCDMRCHNEYLRERRRRARRIHDDNADYARRLSAGFALIEQGDLGVPDSGDEDELPDLPLLE